MAIIGLSTLNIFDSISYNTVNSQKYSDNIYYYEGKTKKILPKVSDGINSALSILGNKTHPAFFNTIDVHIMTQVKDLNPFNKYSENIKLNDAKTNHLAQFKLSDTDIYLNQKGILQYLKEHGISNKNIEKFTEHLVMHEVGHYFDEYYGCKIQNYDEVIEYLNSLTPSELCKIHNCNLSAEVKNNNSLSDEKIFKDTLLKDLSNLNKRTLYSLGLISNNDLINPEYSVKRFIRETTESFYTTPETSDVMRSEIFAQLFSYSLGTDDELRDKYLKAFPNTLNLVSEIINKEHYSDNSNVQKFEILF